MNSYHRTQIHLTGLGFLNVSHFIFKAGSLIGSESEASIVKPTGYEKWRSKRKETFLAGRLAVRDAQVCLKVPTVPIVKAAGGSPVWPSDYTGSLSHTDSQAVAVLLSKSQSIVKGIGIDIELIASANQLDASDMIGIASEFQLLSDLNEGGSIEKPLATLLLFSLKESLYKALYPIVGEFFDFLDAELIGAESDSQNQFSLQIKRDLSDQVQSGFLIKAGFIEQNGNLLTWAYW
ncbi:4'-phosphopantetheinyl transferase family protein [Marinomonas transparens]|uniref:Enterobactin synthase component D n=1 Tax=Marinomonas transparens TaxID=2795388 RepID=A0A934N7R6_9GAMM|nr:4'-phosphopantetheinyl transferase superfamily protein [Marinomonas transparens]MBJ7539336.1 4'-phosphopantetheinyl transferase superfamily protein [Marinomonas transparens]